MAGAGSAPRKAGPYEIEATIGTGGMGAVHVARRVDTGEIVALKQLHENLGRDPRIVAMFLDEARLASLIVHPNVVRVREVFWDRGDLLMVMAYVPGASLFELARAAAKGIPIPIAAGIVIAVLAGLHAAHELKSERGEPLGVVHRDLSPHNVLVGDDGIARITDFGVAKAAWSLHKTGAGQMLGKLTYMAPEHLRGEAVDRRADVWAAAVVLWELLVGRRLFEGSEADVMVRILDGAVEPPSRYAAAARPLDEVVMRGLRRPVGERYASALEMAGAIAASTPAASVDEIARWARTVLGRVEREAPQTPAAPARAARFAGGVVAGLLLVGAVAGAGWWALHDGRTDRRKPRPSTSSSTSAAAPTSSAPVPVLARSSIPVVDARCPMGFACAFVVAPDLKRVPTSSLVSQIDALARRSDPRPELLMLSIKAAVHPDGIDATAPDTSVMALYRSSSSSSSTLTIVLRGSAQSILFANMAKGAPNESMAAPLPACSFERAVEVAQRSGLAATELVEATYTRVPALPTATWLFENGISVDASCSIKR